jgi:uncharacterized protein YvpB
MRGKKFFLITFSFLIGVAIMSFVALNLGKVTYSIHFKNEIIIKFNKEIKLTTGILTDPFVKAEVKTRGLFGTKEIRIIPTEDFPKGENIKINFEYKKVFTNKSVPFEDSVNIPISIDIKSFNINEVNGFVSVNPKITLEVNSLQDNNYELRIKEFQSVWKKDSSLGVITFEPVDNLPLGVELTFVLLDGEEILYEKKFITSDQPKIIDITKKEYFLPGDIVDIYFNKPMDINSEPLSINAPGSGKWISETYYSFTLGDIDPGGQYLFELKSGSISKDGGFVIDAQSYVVKAPGEVVAEIIRAEDDSQIKVIFNQPVDKEDVEFRFLTVPKINGTFSWADNTMFFNIDKLSYETTYNITVPREIKPSFGIPNKKSFNLSFTTEPTPFKNDIPISKTKYLKGGSLSAIVNVLAFYKIKTTEETILQKMGQDSSSRSGNVWGDPRKVFVGPYDESTGYGVHAGVIARIISGYGKNVTLLTNPTVSAIAKEVFAGKVVIVISADASDSWQVAGGATIKTGKNLKYQIVSGVYGKSSLKGFFLNDPQTGEKYKYITASSMTSLLKTVAGVTDQVIVVK